MKYTYCQKDKNNSEVNNLKLSKLSQEKSFRVIKTQEKTGIKVFLIYRGCQNARIY